MQNHQNTTLLQEAQPLVTFIITCYNLPPTMLCECLDSIIRLSLRPSEREIIVVDDGSAEPPLNDLKRYADDIVYLRKPNGGVSTARNMGMRTATGRYIQFVDGDDWLLHTGYEHCLDILRYGQADIVMFDFTRQQPDEAPADYEDQGPMNGTELMRQQNIAGATCLTVFRSDITGKLTFTPGISHGEDEEFTAQLLLRAEAVVRTTAKAYYYRERQTSATGNTSAEAVRKRLDDNLRVIKNLYSRTPILPTNERVALERRVAQMTMDLIYNTIVLTRDHDLVNERIEQLRAEGLFPLPDRNYTTKYKWFRQMTNSSAGMTLLMKVLPLMSKER